MQAYLETNATKIGLVNREQFDGFQSITKQTDYPLQKMVLGNSIALFSKDAAIKNISIRPGFVGDDDFRFYEAPAPAWQSNLAGAGANGISGDGVVGANPHFGTKADVVDNPVTYPASSMNVRNIPENPNRNISSGSLQSISDVLNNLNGSVGPWTASDYNGMTSDLDTVKIATLFPSDTHVKVTDNDVEAVQESISPIL